NPDQLPLSPPPPPASPMADVCARLPPGRPGADARTPPPSRPPARAARAAPARGSRPALPPRARRLLVLLRAPPPSPPAHAPGPVPQAWPLWQGKGDTALRALPYDTAQAAALLARRGWRDSDGDGIRDRGGVKLAFHILVPTTSAVRRQYARLLQEQFRTIGA